MSGIFTMELGEQFLKAAGLAWACFLWGIVVFRVVGNTMHGQAMARLLIALAPGILTCFGYHSVRQYNVVLAVNGIPFQEVADNGGRGDIDTITLAGGERLEWISYRSRFESHRAVLSGADCCGGCDCGPKGCPTTCEGGCLCIRRLQGTSESGSGRLSCSEQHQF